MNLVHSLRKSIRIDSKKFIKLFSTQTVGNGWYKSTENDPKFEDFKDLAADKRQVFKIKIILNEYLSYKNSEEHKASVPSTLTVKQMQELLNITKHIRRGKFFRDNSVAERRHLMSLMKKSEDSDGVNQLTRPLLTYELEKLLANRLKTSALFGQNVVFDLSFDKHMSTSECKNLAEQLYRIYHYNRYESVHLNPSELPFTLTLCNVCPEGKTYKFLEFLYPRLLTDQSFLTITPKPYLELFPKQELIFLSPHAEHVLTEYDSTAVYIIGGIVDRREIITLSQPKAAEQQIRCMRLPIDTMLSKCNVMSLDAVFRILTDLKVFGVFNESMTLEQRVRKYLPNIKLKSRSHLEYERMTSAYLSELSTLDFEDEEDFVSNK